MGFILTAIGLVLLVISVVGVALGLYMSADQRTRKRGRLFAVLWVPALAASSGVLMRDSVTFVVGLLCFLIAGAVFVFEGDTPPELSEDNRLARESTQSRLLDSERTTTENKTRGKTQGSGRVAS